eukprot:763268-Hanusia_phi.AAC.5
MRGRGRGSVRNQRGGGRRSADPADELCGGRRCCAPAASVTLHPHWEQRPLRGWRVASFDGT